jgi:hypothetical protein
MLAAMIAGCRREVTLAPAEQIDAPMVVDAPTDVAETASRPDAGLTAHDAPFDSPRDAPPSFDAP